MDKTSRYVRASRIPEDTWESWREDLVRLYLEHGMLRKDIVEKMAKEHQFVVTTKQLKYRFRQWGINKYISAQDMAIMGNLLQKHQMPGVDIRILYKGQNVDLQRIERACRRQKITVPFDIVQPSHIEVQVIPLPAFSPISDTLLSQRGHLNESVIENERAIDDIERQARRRTSNAKVQDDDNPINNPALGPIIVESGNTESLILPLELCKSHLIRSLDHPLLQRAVIGEPVTARLIKLLQSRWLLSAMNEVLCWAYETAARRSRRLVGASHDFDIYSVPVKEPGDKRGIRPCRPPETRKDVATSLRRATSRSQLLVASSTGTISLGYSSVSETNPSTIKSEQLLALAITFMPRSKDRTVGMSIIFGEIQDTVGAQKISPHIRTFNVIPKDSAIINSVLHNNLEEVQNLFASGEASPLDVDPDGFSLLSYAMYNGCSPVFLTLLAGGAGTQNCNQSVYASSINSDIFSQLTSSSYGSTLDIVWAIWFRYMDNISHVPNRSFTSIKPLEDFDQCAQMTHAALSRGCDIEDAVSYNAHRANALFEVNESFSTNSVATMRALEYLIEIGYDLEKQDDVEGLTPLLHAVVAYRPQAIKCIKTYIERGANIHVRNLKGRGALHCALIGPHSLHEWEGVHPEVRGEGDSFDDEWYLRGVYHTDVDNPAEDYNSKRSAGFVPHHPRRDRGMLSWIDTMQGNSWPKPSYVPGDLYDELPIGKLFRGDVEPAYFPISYSSDKSIIDHASTPEDDMLEYIICRDYGGVQHIIRNPIRVLKLRLRYMLLILLEAGCNPNMLDDKGKSPNDYAERDDLLPQWEWALRRAGYVLVNGQWARNTMQS